MKMTTMYEKVAENMLYDMEVQCDYDEGSWDFSGCLKMNIGHFDKDEEVFITVNLQALKITISSMYNVNRRLVRDIKVTIDG